MDKELLNDFVNEDYKELNIDGKTFKYKPVTAKDENEWLNEYIERDEAGKTKQNLGKLNECKLRNIVSVPYTKEIINTIIGIDKDWNDLSKEQRVNLFGRLKPEIFNQLIIQINKIDKGVEGDIKNV